MSPTVDEALSQPVYSRGATKRFGELHVDEVADRANELAEGAGFGHGSRVAGVAMAWRELAGEMRERGADRVDQLDSASISKLAERLWIAPPGGSLLP